MSFKDRIKTESTSQNNSYKSTELYPFKKNKNENKKEEKTNRRLVKKKIIKSEVEYKKNNTNHILKKIKNSYFQKKGLNTFFFKNIEEVIIKSYKKAETYDLITKKELECIVFGGIESLVKKLTRVTSRVLVLELHYAKENNTLTADSSKLRYEEFSTYLRDDKFRDKIFDKYPRLKQVIKNSCEFCIENIRLFCERYSRDVELIKSTFFSGSNNTLISLELGAGDSHNKGKNVAIASFSDGSKIVYKPRCIEIEEKFYSLLDSFNHQLPKLYLHRPKTITKNGYGWVEFVSYESCPSPKAFPEFYFRLGALNAVLYAFHSTDIHYENIIAHGSQPVLVDLESLFQPVIGQEPAPPQDPFSVLDIGILPTKLSLADSKNGHDYSALGATSNQSANIVYPSWINEGTDEIQLDYKTTSFQKAQSIPYHNQQDANPGDYAHEFIAGFIHLYRFIERNKEQLIEPNGELEQFDHVKSRVIFRDTGLYYNYLSSLSHPDTLSDEALTKQCLGILDIGVCSEFCESNLTKLEQVSLCRDDIPYFWTEPASKTVQNIDGELTDILPKSGKELARERIQSLGKQDLENQIKLIKAAFQFRFPDKHIFGSYPQSIDEHSLDPESAALFIGKHLIENAIYVENIPIWYGGLVKSSQYNLTFLNNNLYDGQLGIILFLGYLGFATDDQSITDIAQRTCQYQIEKLIQTEYLRDLDRIGLVGAGGIIYALSQLQKIWPESDFSQAFDYLLKCVENNISNEHHYDLISGSAGAILALLNLKDTPWKTRAITIASQCAQHLIKHKQTTDKGFGWKNASQSQPYTGYSHGCSGFIHAFSALYRETRSVELLDLIDGLLDYENAHFDENTGKWTDLETNSTSIPVWCRGSGGILVSRVEAMSHLPERYSSVLLKDINRATLDLEKQTSTLSNCLCHGESGNSLIEALYTQSISANKTQQGTPNHLSQQLKSRATDWHDMSLFTGLAGVGWKLLSTKQGLALPKLLSLGSAD